MIKYKRWRPEDGYIRHGECVHCGACCDLLCPYLKWVVKHPVTLSKDQEVKLSYFLESKCTVFDKNVEWEGCTKQARLSFPDRPEHLHVLECPGYYFTDKEGHRLVRKQIKKGIWVIFKVIEE